MIEKLLVYKKAVVGAIGMILMLATLLAPLFPVDSPVGKVIAVIVAAGTVFGIAKVTNLKPAARKGPTLRSGPPPYTPGTSSLPTTGDPIPPTTRGGTTGV